MAQMTMKQAGIGAISALAILTSTPVARAASLSSSAVGQLKANGAANFQTEKAAYRRCW
jgi:hypothetical protein